MTNYMYGNGVNVSYAPSIFIDGDVSSIDPGLIKFIDNHVDVGVAQNNGNLIQIFGSNRIQETKPIIIKDGDEKEDNVTIDENFCVVCLSNKKCILLHTCNHVCLCESCLSGVIKDKKIDCPMCRQISVKWNKVFI